MILMHVAIPEDGLGKKAALLDATYFGPVYPEAPPFRNPDVDLFEIGVTAVKVMVGPTSKRAPTRRPR